MRRLSSFVAILLLLSAALPLLACMTDRAMTREESACCRDMHGNCGEMARMGCCRIQVRSDEHSQIAVTSPQTHVHWVVVAWLAPIIAPKQGVTVFLLQGSSEHWPPGLLTVQSTILRI